jgi:hypothetical protein
MEAFGLALTECGDAAAELVLAHIQQKYGFRIEPKFFPVYLASWREWERRQRSRMPPPPNPLPEDGPQAA